LEKRVNHVFKKINFCLLKINFEQLSGWNSGMQEEEE
jgi:hypothetical protein